MSTMDDYLSQLKMSFEEEDLEDYYELEEDLLEQLAICLAHGQTEEEVVTGLASPEEMAADYYEDRSLDAARNAKTYVVPKEKVQEVFIQSQKKRIRKFWQVLLKIGKPLVFLFLLCAAVFFIVYIAKEMMEEQHLAIIPTVAVLFLTAVLLQFIRSWSSGKKRLFHVLSFGLGILSLGVGSYFTVNNQLFYTGRSYYKSIELTSEEAVEIKLRSDAFVEVTTVEVPSSEKPSMIVRGQFKESDIKQIEAGKYEDKIDLALDQENLFELFTRTGRSQLIFFIPKGMVLADFDLKLTQGNLRLIDLDTKNVKLRMESGDIYAKNVIAEKGSIFSEYGDTVIEESAVDLTLKSLTGKAVITGLLGNLSIDMADGVSILKMIHGDEVNVANHSSRLVLEDSEIKKLTATGESGSLVVKRTSGELAISNKTGKIIAEENGGQLQIQNDSGPTIVIQSTKIDGEVSSKTGFIKWLQNPDEPIRVDATTRDGELRNEFSDVIDTDKKAVITSTFGDVKVLKKVD